MRQIMKDNDGLSTQIIGTPEEPMELWFELFQEKLAGRPVGFNCIAAEGSAPKRIICDAPFPDRNETDTDGRRQSRLEAWFEQHIVAQATICRTPMGALMKALRNLEAGRIC